MIRQMGPVTRVQRHALRAAVLVVLACRGPSPDAGGPSEDVVAREEDSTRPASDADAGVSCTGRPGMRVPRVEVRDTAVLLVLPPQMNERLAAHAPGFTPRPLSSFAPAVHSGHDFGCDEQPSALVAELNGDSLPDVAALGGTDRMSLLIVLLSDTTGYRYLELEAHHRAAGGMPADPQYYIFRVPQGSYTSRFPPDDTTAEALPAGRYALHLGHDAIGWAYIEKAAGIRYYRNGRFRDFVTAD